MTGRPCLKSRETDLGHSLGDGIIVAALAAAVVAWMYVRHVVIELYAVVAAATAVWLMRDLGVVSIVTALAIGVPVAAGTSAYGRRLATEQ